VTTRDQEEQDARIEKLVVEIEKMPLSVRQRSAAMAAPLARQDPVADRGCSRAVVGEAREGAGWAADRKPVVGHDRFTAV
jgi:hypothetical protein